MTQKKAPAKKTKLDRRKFLRQGLSVGVGTAVAGTSIASRGEPLGIPQWSRELGPGVATMPYGAPSGHESAVVRKWLPWLLVERETSVSFTPLQHLSGSLTPNGLFFERHHAGIPAVDPRRHRLVLHGMVGKPLVFTVEDLKRFARVSATYFTECAGNTALEWQGARMNSVQYSHGMLSNCEWTGVRLKTLLDEAGLSRGAKWLLAESADAAGYARGFPLEKALDDALVAYAQNGEALRPEQGYPLRLVLPGWEGSASIKWLRRIEVGDKPWKTREETARYTDLLEDGTSRQFTFVQEAKSIIVNPCPESPLNAKGAQTIHGLAWSGRGRIARVDVSFDGGRSWRESRLQDPVHPKSLTGFSIPWDWNGDDALLQSRAMDETGYVQPTIQQLRAVRGEDSIYHNNMIMTWHVKATGEVQNVQVG